MRLFSVLILNKGFQVVNVVGIERAFCMLAVGAARALDECYRLCDLDSWLRLRVRRQDDAIGLVCGNVRAPRVLVLSHYDKVRAYQIKFSRQNIYARDKYSCQYCGRKPSKKELNLDHVLPRSRGGETSWENVVTSCIRCNSAKGDRTPLEAGKPLLRPAKKPRWSQLFSSQSLFLKYPEWRPFLNHTLGGRSDEAALTP